MQQESFQCLQNMAHMIQDRGASVPASEHQVEYWHGAAFEVLGTRCIASSNETRSVVDLSPTIPIPGVKHWVRGLANVSGRVLAIADLSAFLSKGASSSNGKQALVIADRGIHTGVVIDQSLGGMRFPIDSLQTDFTIDEQLQPFISGIFPSEHGDYAVFEFERLLTDPDFAEAGVITIN